MCAEPHPAQRAHRLSRLTATSATPTVGNPPTSRVGVSEQTNQRRTCNFPPFTFSFHLSSLTFHFSFLTFHRLSFVFLLFLLITDAHRSVWFSDAWLNNVYVFSICFLHKSLFTFHLAPFQLFTFHLKWMMSRELRTVTNERWRTNGEGWDVEQ